jgi:hypothetical protein
MDIGSPQVRMSLDFDQTFSGAALDADGRTAYVLMGGELRSFNTETGELSNSRPIAPNTLNLTLNGQDGLIGVTTRDSVRLVRME